MKLQAVLLFSFLLIGFRSAYAQPQRPDVSFKDFAGLYSCPGTQLPLDSKHLIEIKPWKFKITNKGRFLAKSISAKKVPNEEQNNATRFTKYKSLARIKKIKTKFDDSYNIYISKINWQIEIGESNLGFRSEKVFGPDYNIEAYADFTTLNHDGAPNTFVSCLKIRDLTR